jgi:hypothetical protein
MTERLSTLRSLTPLGVLLCALGLLAAGEASAPDASRPDDAKRAVKSSSNEGSSAAGQYTTETLRGRVVWLDDALKRRFGIATEADAAQKSVVLQTADGKLVPIVPDVRGHAFAVDPRLRDIELELLVRRYADAPHVQVIRVMKSKQGVLYEIDYWCDICAIAMYTLKPCECCQGETRLRERAVKDGSPGG